MFLGMSVCLFICVCENCKTNERIFLICFYVGRTWTKEEVVKLEKDPDDTLDTKKSRIFNSPMFNDFLVMLSHFGAVPFLRYILNLAPDF